MSDDSIYYHPKYQAFIIAYSDDLLLFMPYEQRETLKSHLSGVFELSINDPEWSAAGTRNLDFLTMCMVFFRDSRRVLLHDGQYRAKVVAKFDTEENKIKCHKIPMSERAVEDEPDESFSKLKLTYSGSLQY